MYEQDSLFTLTLAERLGVLMISLLLSLFLFAVLWRIVRAWRLPARLVTALVLFACFVWLSPQVYYTFYIFIFDGLPWQLVTNLPAPNQVLRLLVFQDNPTLSAHGQGLLGWLLIAFAALAPRLSISTSD